MRISGELPIHLTGTQEKILNTLRGFGLDFETLFEAFGGKLAHWQDYITDYGKCYFLLWWTLRVIIKIRMSAE